MTTRNSTTESIHIDGLTHDGRGVGHLQGKTLFISEGVPGDSVTVKITHQQDSYDEADIVAIQSPSKDRITPFCQYNDICGGCQLQHLSLDAQRYWKHQNFTTQLSKAVETKQCTKAAPLVGDGTGYRRRARLGLVISKKDKQARLGFRQKASNELIDIEHCPVLTPALNQAIQDNKAALIATASRAYKEITFVEADNGVFISQEETTNDSPAPYYTLNKQSDHPLKLAFLQNGFIQVNATLNQAMVAQAVDWLELKSDHKVLDLFCGMGNFTLPIAQQVESVVGIEGERSLIEMATHNADSNQLTNVQFHKTNLFNDATPLPWFKKQSYDRILLDPGRQGAFDLCKTLGKLNAKLIVYVSCNSATLIRDIKELEKQGYRLSKSGLIDMFPHTTHTEVMVQLRKTQKPLKKAKTRPTFKI